MSGTMSMVDNSIYQWSEIIIEEIIIVFHIISHKDQAHIMENHIDQDTASVDQVAAVEDGE